jgi:hypothetical protein
MAWLAANATVGAGILLCGVALVLAGVGLVAWRRVRHSRLLWVSLAFMGLLGQGAILTWQAYGRRGDIAAGDPLTWLIGTSLAVTLALYAGVLKR